MRNKKTIYKIHYTQLGGAGELVVSQNPISSTSFEPILPPVSSRPDVPRAGDKFPEKHGNLRTRVKIGDKVIEDKGFEVSYEDKTDVVKAVLDSHEKQEEKHNEAKVDRWQQYIEFLAHKKEIEAKKKAADIAAALEAAEAITKAGYEAAEKTNQVKTDIKVEVVKTKGELADTRINAAQMVTSANLEAAKKKNEAQQSAELQLIEERANLAHEVIQSIGEENSASIQNRGDAVDAVIGSVRHKHNVN